MRQRIRALVTVGLTAAVLAAACGSKSNNPDQAPSSASRSTVASARPATTPVSTDFPTPDEKAMYPALKSDFDNTIVPAAKKEGQLTWYSCTTQDDAEPVIAGFNRVYPQIQVNYVYMTPNDAFLRIVAEETANHVLGDYASCGGTSSRVLDFDGYVDTYIPPSAVDPSASFWYDPVDADKHDTFFEVDLGGLEMNTKVIPPSRYPKTWWDFVQDPYWIDLIKKGDVAIIDPRQPGHGRGVTYGLDTLKTEQYGDKWLQALAALKPKRIVTESGQVATGEVYAIAFTNLRQKLLDDRTPVTLICPDPGCVTTTTLSQVLKGAPHPHAARVFSDFMLTKAGQQIWAARGGTVARTDVAVDPNRSYQSHPPMFWPDDATAKTEDAFAKHLSDSKLFDYP